MSTITFGGLQARILKEDNSYETERSFNADVYVFCTQICDDHDRYDCVDLSQWTFDVVAARSVAALNQKSMRLTTVRRISGGLTPFAELAAAVSSAAAPTAI